MQSSESTDTFTRSPGLVLEAFGASSFSTGKVTSTSVPFPISLLISILPPSWLTMLHLVKLECCFESWEATYTIERPRPTPGAKLSS